MTPSRARATVDLEAVAGNCTRLLSELDGTQLCAVVKADGYGHGALECAEAALGAGATWLAVATVGEAAELREAGVRVPLLIMGALGDRTELARAIALEADIVLWSERAVAVAGEEAALSGSTARVHVKLDSGMGRLGTRDPELATAVLAAAQRAERVRVAGLMTHFATADEPDDEGFFERQLETFSRWVQARRGEHPHALVHAANSAAVLRDRRAHFDMARCGVAIYGLDPYGRDPDQRGLRPALELTSYVADVKRCAAGESTGYGRSFVAGADTHLGMLPLGYGDGWRRGLSNNAEVLIDGRRWPLVGTVSMDNVAVDLGADADAMGLLGAEAVLVGRRGRERITVEELAARLDTINYEITCGLSARVERAYGPGAWRPRG